jgi:hypothetical protein
MLNQISYQTGTNKEYSGTHAVQSGANIKHLIIQRHIKLNHKSLQTGTQKEQSDGHIQRTIRYLISTQGAIRYLIREEHMWY